MTTWKLLPCGCEETRNEAGEIVEERRCGWHCETCATVGPAECARRDQAAVIAQLDREERWP